MPAERITMERLKRQAQNVAKVTGIPFSLDFANGGVKLESEDGSRILSERMSKSEMSSTLYAIMNFVQEGERFRRPV